MKQSLQTILQCLLFIACIAQTVCADGPIANLSLLPESIQGQFSSNSSPAMVAARRAMLATKLKAARTRSNAKAGTNWAGGWHGRLVLVTTNCYSVFKSSFLFRHIIAMSGNRVAIATSSDGTLYGLSSDKGRQIEAVRTYVKKGVAIEVYVIYKKMSKNSSASMGYGVSLITSYGQCDAGFGATAIRAF